MPLNAEARSARARLAIHKRHHPDADASALAAEFLAALERSRQDEHINALIATWPPLTPEQRARLRPVFNAALWAPSEGGATG